MSGQPKKKTLAGLRAEKERRKHGHGLARELLIEFYRLCDPARSNSCSLDDGWYVESTSALAPLTSACELLHDDPELYVYARALFEKAKLHIKLGQHILAVSTLRVADEVLVKTERMGQVNAADLNLWRGIVLNMGHVFADAHQLESAKSCYLRLLTWPRTSVTECMSALQGIARYHKVRKEWGKVIECCEEGMKLLPKLEEIGDVGFRKERLFLLFADAAEGQGDLTRAYEYDKKAKAVWIGKGRTDFFSEFVACDRREAVRLLAAGRPHDAAQILKESLNYYSQIVRHVGIHLMRQHILGPVVAALKVLAAALVETGLAQNVSHGLRIQAEVEETEAILSGYWEGVLAETRRELAEQRRAAAAVGNAIAGEAPEVEEAGTMPATKKKSKAAKRKQKKRKAQQQKRMVEMAEAAAAAVQARREEVTQGQGQQEDQDQEQEQEHEVQRAEQDEKQELQEEENSDQKVAAAALVAMAADEKKGRQEEEEEEEEEECSVCLNFIESDDADNPAGPPLRCGHRYHMFCLNFWVEKCRSKCIEPTCPYCRSPLLDLEAST